MPFGFLKRRSQPPAAEPVAPAPADSQAPRQVSLEGLTDEWRLRASITLSGRLIDALNRQRESLAVSGVEWAPADGSGPFEPAPGIRAVDPYDLVVVVATPETLGPATEDERRAHQVHKIQYYVEIQAPPYRIVGTIRLRPGNQPESLMDRATEMFVALTEPVVALGDREVDLGPEVQAVLVNRFYLRGIRQVDRETGLPVEALPELGGPGSGGAG